MEPKAVPPFEAGGRADFCEVRHVVLSGSDFEIGMRLAQLADAEHGVRPVPGDDPTLVGARRRWFEIFYPQLARRAEGLAAHFGLRPDTVDYELASLPLGVAAPGCSVGWIPPSRSSTGAPLLSRNFDFTTATLPQLLGIEGTGAEPPLAGDPFVLECHPTNGLTHTVICAFDLLSGATEGMNEAGLVVALLADDESDGAEPLYDAQVGIGEHELCRYLLENCRTVDEAATALRLAKHYYSFIRCHYLVGDASGRSFVWEHSPGWNREYLLWSDDVQIVTNHLLHRHATIDDLPSEPGNGWTYDRARRLSEAIAAREVLGPDDLIDLHASVRIREPGIDVRTLWHTVIDVGARTMRSSFYLGDDGDSERRTPYQAFTVAPEAPRSASGPAV